jgi:hypothetical protein
MVPPKVRPGTASAEMATGWPTRMRDRSFSNTSLSIHTELAFRIVQSGSPAATACPTLTGRDSISPPMAAVMVT